MSKRFLTTASEHNPYSSKRSLPVGEGWSVPAEDSPLIFPLRKWAQLDGGEADFLYELPSIIGPGNYCMLGDGRGGGAGMMAMGLKNRKIEGHVHTVDTYRGGFKYGEKRGRRYCGHNAERFKTWGLTDHITQHMMTTREAYDVFLKEGILFKAVFIDADHTYEGVKEDLLYYSTILDSPGFILFHDTNQDYTDRVINEFVVGVPGITFVAWVHRIKMYRID